MLHSYMNWTLAAPLRNLSGSISTFSSILPESCACPGPLGDPATSSLFALPRTTDHEFRLACIQPLSFLCFADSCCTMDACNPFPFNYFRTLSIAMGVYTPFTQSVFREGSLHTHSVEASLRSNRNPFISFFLTPLRTLSFTTRGVHPLPQAAGSGEGEGRQNAQ
jgi:hypothetical protein